MISARTKMESLLEMSVQDLRSTSHEEALSAFDSELLSLSQSELASLNTVVVPSYTGEDGCSLLMLDQFWLTLFPGDHQLAEEVTEDKLRRVRHQLEPGDVIEVVSTVCQVSGVNSFHKQSNCWLAHWILNRWFLVGMLIFGHTHLYMLEGLVENSEGEVIDAGDVPEGLFLISGSAVDVRNSQRAQWWYREHFSILSFVILNIFCDRSLEQVSGFSDRMFLFQDVGWDAAFTAFHFTNPGVSVGSTISSKIAAHCWLFSLISHVASGFPDVFVDSLENEDIRPQFDT